MWSDLSMREVYSGPGENSLLPEILLDQKNICTDKNNENCVQIYIKYAETGGTVSKAA